MFPDLRILYMEEKSKSIILLKSYNIISKGNI